MSRDQSDEAFQRELERVRADVDQRETLIATAASKAGRSGLLLIQRDAKRKLRRLEGLAKKRGKN